MPYLLDSGGSRIEVHVALFPAITGKLMNSGDGSPKPLTNCNRENTGRLRRKEPRRIWHIQDSQCQNLALTSGESNYRVSFSLGGRENTGRLREMVLERDRKIEELQSKVERKNRDVLDLVQVFKFV